jgi:VanZ family protein
MAIWQPSTLARYLFAAYVPLIVYASLHPFSGWRDRGLPPFAFLTAPFSRPIPVFDVVANIIGYVPLGLLAVFAVYPWLRRGYALVFGLACSASLSFLLESLQLYLPARTSSNLDLLANTVGGLVGALVALGTTRPLMDAEGLQRLRNRLFLAGRRVDLGLVLLGLWLFAQLNPETLLFGTGDVRDVFKTPSGKLYPAEVFLRVEAGVACANGLAAGLLALCLIARDQPARAVVVIFLAAALAVHSFGFGMVVSSQDVLAWVTPGALYAQLALVGLALMAATALVNLAPANPYMTASFALWQQGHFLNFNGATRVVSALWPFAAMVYLVLLANDRGQQKE